MSLRNIKKLQSPENLLVQTESDEDSEEISRLKKNSSNKFGGFDLLSVSEREDDNETENFSASAAPKIDQKKKKTKKTKRRQKTGKTGKKSSEDDYNLQEDDFARTVKEVDQLFGTSSYTVQPAEKQSSSIVQKTLLSVQHKNLNPQTEMKKMFGKIVQDQKKRSQRGGNFRSFKSIYLTNPKDNWPAVNKTGIYMNLVQDATTSKTNGNQNILNFAFEHSANYRQVQLKFLQSMESIDSNNIVKIINMSPYHIDALIQLSELCKMSEDMAMAAELIEHALYAYEYASASHSMFSLTQGNCRMDYRRQENRGFFIVLFKHAQFLSQRACNRTALELAKLILSLAPEEDPLAIILLIDFYALRSKQYDFLIQLYQEWEHTHNLSQLPNIAYSYALALFLLNDKDACDDALQYALMMFPGVLKPLLESLSVQADSRLNTHKYFGPSAHTSSPLALQQLMALYVARCKVLWSGDQNVLLWLERNVNIVLDKVDKKDEIVSEYAVKRSQRYLKPPRNILRHVILSDFKEAVPIADFLKKESEAIVHFDPLPPIESVNIYEKPKVTSTQAAATSASGLQLFFQSLLPSFSNTNVQPPPQVQDAPRALVPIEGDAAEGVAVGGEQILQSYAELRSSLLSITDAMRDFLSDLRQRNPNDDGDLDENDSSSTDGEEDVNNYLT
ncbi:unnamed protein product [Diamesa serratosioi]